MDKGWELFTASLPPHTSSDEDWALMKNEISSQKLHLETRVHDIQLAKDIRKTVKQKHNQKGKSSKSKESLDKPFERPFKPAESNAEILLHFKGVVSEEMIKETSMKIAGVGVAICDRHENRLVEIKKVLGDEESTHPEAVELSALIHGLKWVLDLDMQRVKFSCDDSNILKYVSGQVKPNDPSVEALVDEVSHLQQKFTLCQAIEVRCDLTYVLKLARDAINSKIRWKEDGIDYETCVFCCDDVRCSMIFEVPRCFHRFCFSCMRTHASVTLETGKNTVCPYEGCNSSIDVEDCGDLLEPDMLALMVRKKRENLIPEENRVYCQNKECLSLMTQRELLIHSKKYFLDAAESGARKCIKCGFCFCINCDSEWHCNMTCAVFRKTATYRVSDQAYTEDAIGRKYWMTCTKCKSVMALEEGCKHVICSCGHEFCYTCGAEWIKKKATCKCRFMV